MTAQRFVPRYSVDLLRDEFGQLFSDLFVKGPAAQLINGAAAAVRAPSQGPAMNLWEDAERYYVEAEVPGLKADDLEIVVVGKEVTIRGTRKSSERTEGLNAHRRERPVGEFKRILRLASEVDSSAVEATLKDGVLLVTLPKAEEAKPKRIQIRQDVS